MDKGAKKYGNIYEIPLPNGKFRLNGQMYS